MTELKTNEDVLKSSDFLQAVVGLIRQMMDTENRINPFLAVDMPDMSVVGGANEPGVLITQFPGEMLNSGESKDKLAVMLKEMLKARPSDQVAFVTEAWGTVGELPAEYWKMYQEGVLNIADFPNKYKQEIGMIKFTDLRNSGRKEYMGRIVFQRDDNGTIMSVDDPIFLLQDTSGGVSFKGRFDDLI